MDRFTRAWARVSPPRFFRRRPKLSVATSFRKTIECAAKLCSADYIMNTGWKRSPHEHRRSYCARQRLGECHFRRFDQNMSFSANWICRETNAAVGTPAEELML